MRRLQYGAWLRWACCRCINISNTFRNSFVRTAQSPIQMRSTNSILCADLSICWRNRLRLRKKVWVHTFNVKWASLCIRQRIILMQKREKKTKQCQKIRFRLDEFFFPFGQFFLRYFVFVHNLGALLLYSLSWRWQFWADHIPELSAIFTECKYAKVATNTPTSPTLFLCSDTLIHVRCIRLWFIHGIAVRGWF